MTGILELTRYKYTDVVLPESQVKINGKVNVVNGRLYSTEGTIQGLWEGNRLTFILKQHSGPDITDINMEFDEPKMDIGSWPSGLSVDRTIEEFKQFILTDIA